MLKSAEPGSSVVAQEVRERTSRDLYPDPALAWYSVCLIAFISTLSNIDRSVITLLVEPIKRDLLLSDTEISLLIGFAFSFFYMMFGLPMSRLTDVKPRKIILASGLSIWSVATAFCGLAQNFWQLFVARGLVGAGESVKGPNSMSLISDMVPRDKFPRAYSIYQLGITGGMAASMIIGGVLLALLDGITLQVPGIGTIRDWQMVFFICGVPGLLVAALLLATVPEPIRKGRRVKGSVPVRDVVRFLLSHKAIYLPLLLALSIGSIESFGMQVWRPAFFERTYGWTPEIVGPYLGVIALVATPVGLFLGTVLSERLVKKGMDDALLRVVFIAQLLSFPFSIITPLMPSPWLALGCGALGTIFGMMAAPAQNSAIQIITPNEMRGQITAVYLFTISVIGGGLGPTVVALITDFIFVDESMLRYAMASFGAVVGPLGVVLLYLAMKPYGRAYRSLVEREASEE